jgi:iron complex outermembrane receptor protein
VQDHVKAKLAYDFSPTVRATYVLRAVAQRFRRPAASYLRMPPASRSTAAPVNIGGRAYTLAPTDFNLSNEKLRHVMHGLTLKSHERRVRLGTGGQPVRLRQGHAARRRRSRCRRHLPAAPGRIVDQGGTGWNTFAAKGVWRPQGHGAHIVEFGYQREGLQAGEHRERHQRLDRGEPGARNAGLHRPHRDQQRCMPRTPGNSRRAGRPCWACATSAGKRATAAPRTRSRPSIHPERTGTMRRPRRRWPIPGHDDWVLKASLGRAVRMPTVSELYQGGVNARRRADQQRSRT